MVVNEFRVAKCFSVVAQEGKPVSAIEPNEIVNSKHFSRYYFLSTYSGYPIARVPWHVWTNDPYTLGIKRLHQYPRYRYSVCLHSTPASIVEVWGRSPGGQVALICRIQGFQQCAD